MDYQERRTLFVTPDDAHRPIYYFELPALTADDREEQLRRAVETCRASGCGALIPQLPLGTVLSAEDIFTLREMYALILQEAEKRGLQVGLYLDPALEHAVIRMSAALGESSLYAKQLERKEYICHPGEIAKHALHEGELLSVVAVSEEYGQIIDLRGHAENGMLTFEVPKGNWIIQEYYIAEDREREGANYLSYTASYDYICAVFGLFGDVLTPYFGKTLRILSYSGIGFNGRNRRNWDVSFNKLFSDRYGFDPAPYYPLLFGFDMPEGTHIKTLMMKTRGDMLRYGLIEALHDFAAKHGLDTFGNLSEPKLTTCSFNNGDAMLNNIHSPCALFDKAYLYGLNSVKIAAGAAYNFDVEQVNGELFRNYKLCDKGRLLKDAMNAYARGVNRTALHLTPELTENSDFCDFTARVQAMLRGGRHVADIAMLYPIYHLHSRTCLYFSPADGYEYPATPADADYMTVINAISYYAGHDLTVLHPEAMNERCYTEGGVLYLDNEKNKESFRVLVLPSATIVSLENMRMIKRFFDGGGKILATGQLPTMAFEYDPSGENDREVQRLAEEIFGKDACDKRIMKRYCQNKNDAGGEAIFLYFNASGVDGCEMVKSSTVNEALNSFGVPFDVYIPGMQRLESTGALNTIFPEFLTIGLHITFPGGGMVNHIHKATDDGDIYYFSNTSDTDYNHHVLLRGAYNTERWDPHTGKVETIKHRYFCYAGHIYTNVRLTLLPSRSVFFRAVPADMTDKSILPIKSIEHLQSEHAALMSEF